jgi:hypothetical protein
MRSVDSPWHDGERGTGAAASCDKTRPFPVVRGRQAACDHAEASTGAELMHQGRVRRLLRVWHAGPRIPETRRAKCGHDKLLAFSCSAAGCSHKPVGDRLCSRWALPPRSDPMLIFRPLFDPASSTCLASRSPVVGHHAACAGRGAARGATARRARTRSSAARRHVALTRRGQGGVGAGGWRRSRHGGGR